MRNLKRNLKKGLSALLMVAMLFTSVSIPEMSVNAAPAEDEIIDISVSDDEVIVEESTVEESTTEVATTEVETVEETTVEAVVSEETTEEVVEETVVEVVQEDVGEGEEVTEYIVGGDFANLEWSNGNLGSWAFVGDTWTACSDISTTGQDRTTSDWTNALGLTYQADGTASIQQTVASLPAGSYKMTAYVLGKWNDTTSADYTTTAQLYYGNSVSEGVTIPSSYTEVTYEFDVKSDATDAVVGINIASQTGAFICLDDVTLVRTGDCATTYTLEELSTLYTEAAALIDGKTTEDFKAGYDELNTALATAKDLIDASSEDTDAITAAYAALVAAMAALTPADNAFTFYYYAGADVDTLGLYAWDNVGSAITVTGDVATWYAKGNNDTGEAYVMTEVEGYDGWFSIPVSIAGGTASSAVGIQVYSYDGTNATKLNAYDDWNWTEVWAELFAGESDEYAIWNGYLYSGDEVETVQRNVTLYVYDSTGAPYIMVAHDKDGLSYVDASTGKSKELTVSDFDDGYSNKYYAMTAVEDSENWYSITLSVPAVESGKVFTLNDSTGTWVKDFKVGASGGDWEVDITPVFAGNAYYKDGEFYASMGAADGYSLGQLKTLVDSEEVAAIVANGESKYTSGWTEFNAALTAAQELIASDTYKDADDATMDETIGSAYTTLTDAIKALVEKTPQVTVYYYNEKATVSGNSLYAITWDPSIIRIDSENKETINIGWETTGYIPDAVAVDENNIYSGWTTLKVSLFALTQNGAADNGEGIVYHIMDSTGKSIESFEISGWNNTAVFNALVGSEDGGKIYVKGSSVYESIYAAEVADLKGAVKEAESIFANKDSYKEIGWAEFEAALTAAKNLLAAATTTHTREALATAYTTLVEAMEMLQFNLEAEINVKKVELTDDFITGADVSTYITLKNSGVEFKDKEGNVLNDQGFFDLLYAGGTNWTRIRVWNDPYSGDGKGYGGGNNDLETAVAIGKLATNAGMRVLIDFHYSDFWSDPAKFETPKAWEGYTLEQKVEAVYDYTYDSLVTLKNAGVDVGMVQVGNESNNGICGITGWANMAQIFNSGSKAIRDFNTEFGKDILVAVHFTDPQKGYGTIAKALNDNNVDYDVFASSYYPNIHGDTATLKANLEEVASTYGKKVMVAEMSWPTTWEDGDGHGNGCPKETGQDLRYPISVQGQADALRDIINAVDLINENCPDLGIGAFYWEPAWISKYYAYNADGSVNEEAYAKNKELWEKYGSGWAASYAAEYDPVDAGLWYGGSSMDNQSWFGFDGRALATVEAYKLIRTGATAKLKISEVQRKITTSVSLGGDVDWNSFSSVIATFNDGTTKVYPVVWDEEQKAKVSTDALGEYVIEGVATCEYARDEETITETHDVTLTLKVEPTANELADRCPGFETDYTGIWELEYLPAYDGDDLVTGYSVKATDETPRNGEKALNFYREAVPMHFKAKQTIENLPAGSYTFGGYIQGGSSGDDDIQYAYVNVYKTVSGNELKLDASYRASAVLGGWQNWMNPEIDGIKVEEGDVVEVGMEISASVGGAWGSIDDFYLYGSYDVKTVPVTGGKVTVNKLEAMGGEVVRITATPDKEYTLTKITLSGDDVNEAILKGTTAKSATYDTDTKTAILTYENNADAVTNASFIMPSSPVSVSAEFVDLFEEETLIYVSGNNVKVSEITNQFYTGKAIKPVFTVSYLGYTLKEKTDYTVVYSNNKNLTGDGEPATITITGKGRFTGTKVIEFRIVEDNRQNLSKAVVTFAADYDDAKKKTFYYTGERIETPVNVNFVTKTASGNVMTPVDSADYNVYYQNNMKVGTAKVIVVAKHDSMNVKGSATVNMKIAKCPVSELSIQAPTANLYTGKKLTPDVKVMHGDTLLQKNKDYTVAYKGNVNVTTYDRNNNASSYLIVSGKGNYTGKTAKIPFVITQKSLEDVSISVTVGDLVEKNKAQAPKVVVKDGTTTVNKKFYTYTISKITVSGNELVEGNKVKENGLYKVEVTGKGNYKDTIGEDDSITFQVRDKEHYLNGAKISTKNKVYTGSKITLEKSIEKNGELVVKIGNKAVPTEMYDVKTVNNINVGKATVTIVPSKAGIEAGYYGTKSATFKITKRKMQAMPVVDPTVTGNTITLKDSVGYLKLTLIDKEAQYTGYGLTPEVEIRSVNNADPSAQGILLKAGKDYKIAYSKNVKPGAKAQIKISGLKNYSGSVTFKNVFTVSDRSLNDFDIKINTATYTGKAIKPAIIFTDKVTGEVVNLKAGAAYTVVRYENNKAVAGKSDEKAPTVVIKEKDLNASAEKADKVTKEIKFVIKPAVIKDADVKDIAVQTFRNKPITPAVTVKVGGRKLKAGTDYVVSYTYNSYDDTRGNAYATITGIGNYSGTVKKIFIIK